MAANLPHVKAEWKVQAESLIAYGKCPHCGADFGLSGEPDFLASGEAKHWCRVCQRLMRVTAPSGSRPSVMPLIEQSQYVAEMVALAKEEQGS